MTKFGMCMLIGSIKNWKGGASGVYDYRLMRGTISRETRIMAHVMMKKDVLTETVIVVGGVNEGMLTEWLGVDSFINRNICKELEHRSRMMDLSLRHIVRKDWKAYFTKQNLYRKLRCCEI